jgi:hypothetical protein
MKDLKNAWMPYEDAANVQRQQEPGIQEGLYTRALK